MMIKVKIEGVVLDMKSNLPIIVLRDAKQRILPISVGIFEAQAIAFALEGVCIPRPLTHDLMKNIIEKLESELLRIEITELKGNTFFARLVLKATGKGEVKVDSRPSDAIALALRLNAAVYASGDLLVAKEISSKPITELEVNQFREMIEKMTPHDIWEYLKEKK